MDKVNKEIALINWNASPITARLRDYVKDQRINQVPARLIAANRAGRMHDITRSLAELEVYTALEQLLTTGDFLDKPLKLHENA